MSKLLTDLMEAERRRRQLAISRSAKDLPAKAGDVAFAADEGLRARIEAEHLVAAESGSAARLAANKRGGEAQEERATAGMASSPRGAERIWGRLLAATALALMAGMGAGFWLGKLPAVPVRPWSEDQGVLRLRLDDRLMNPPLEEPRIVPRDRTQ